jgi:hypothetical protein
MGKKNVIAIRQHPDVESERVHYLQAESHADATAWLEALHSNRVSVYNVEIKALRELNGPLLPHGGLFCL